jgi:hypothetical protein
MTCLSGEYLGVQYWTMEEFRCYHFGWIYNSWITFSEPVGDMFKGNLLRLDIEIRIDQYRETQFKKDLNLCV